MSSRLIPVVLLVGCAHGSSVTVSSSSEFTRIAPGKTYEGTEERVDTRTLPFVGPTKFRFFGQAGQRVRFKYFTKTSEGFARSLKLTLLSDSSEVPLKGDETDEYELGSGVLPVDGDYELECYTGVVGSNATADFKLEFTADTTKPVLAIKENQTIKGELTADDRTDLGTGVPTDLYRFDPSGEPRRMAFVTKAEGTKLHVAVLGIDEGKFPDLEDDKWGSSSEEAHVTYVPRGALIKISGNSDKPLGPYELTVLDGRQYQISRFTLVRLGGEAEAEIAADSDSLFRIHGKVGQIYELTANSADTDLVLIVTNAESDPTKLLVAGDDNSGGGTNPRLRFTLPDEQDWMLMVRNKSKTPGHFKLTFDAANLTQEGPKTQSPQLIRR